MQEKQPFFFNRLTQTTAFLILIMLGFAIRLYDFTDLPLDFHPTRQLLSAIKAHGTYYETQNDLPQEECNFAIQQWKSRASLEPEIVDRLVAFTYRFIGEVLWVLRLFSSRLANWGWTKIPLDPPTVICYTAPTLAGCSRSLMKALKMLPSGVTCSSSPTSRNWIASRS